MRFRKLGEEDPRLGLAPLIDIVFLLLVFFMLTSHFQISSGLRVQLPALAQIRSGPQGGIATLVIDRAGQIYLEARPMALGELDEALRTLRNRGGLLHLVLEADRAVPHGRVVEVMDVADRAGVSSIVISARWAAGSRP